MAASVHTQKPRNCGTMNHMCRCASTISRRLKLPASATTPISDRPMNTSYEIICTDERKPPSNAYLLCDDQPPSITAYTTSPAIAKKKSRPSSNDETPQTGVNGTRPNASNIRPIASAGASMKVNLSTNGGVQSSLKKILIMSAATCVTPNGPTRFGP